MQNPNEQIAILQKEIAEKQATLKQLLKTKNPLDLSKFKLKDQEGNTVSVMDLFSETDQIMVIHNMGKSCVYCTLWADGFNGFNEHFNDRIPTFFVSPDDPQTQKEFASSRGWKFNMYSAHESDLLKNIDFQTEKSGYLPGFSIFKKEGEQVFQISKDYFGPGDNYCSIWHMFDMIEEGQNNWAPKYKYVK